MGEDVCFKQFEAIRVNSMRETVYIELYLSLYMTLFSKRFVKNNLNIGLVVYLRAYECKPYILGREVWAETRYEHFQRKKLHFKK